MAKIPKPLIYGGIGAIILTAVILNSPEPDGGVQAGRQNRGSGRTSSKVDERFTEDDYNYVVARLNESLKNAFIPLVSREGSGSGSGLMPNELPSSFTDGEPGWLYTGTVEVNGVPSTLLENKVTGDGMYLKVGEKLKRTMITKIAPTYIEVESYTGRTWTLYLLRDLPDPDDDFYGLEIEPVRPNVGNELSGPMRGVGATGTSVPRTSEQS